MKRFSLTLAVFSFGFFICGLDEADARRQKTTELAEVPEIVKPEMEISYRDPSTIKARKVLIFSVPNQAVDIPRGSTIAFIEFNYIGMQHDVSCTDQVSAAIAQHLADLGRYKVVTRDKIGDVMAEQRFGYSGAVNTTTAARLGEVLGADILVYGQVQLCESSAKRPEETSELEEEIAASVATMAIGQELRREFGTEVSERMNEKFEEELGGEFGGLGSIISRFVGSKIANAGKQREEAMEEEEEQVEKILDDREATIRSYVIAQIQLIEADTGRQIFMTSLEGEFKAVHEDFGFDLQNRELIAKAADDLSNNFIDKILTRPDIETMKMYTSDRLPYDEGIDLVQLGNCHSAEKYFSDLYSDHKDMMTSHEVAKLMYNHGIALMCANRTDEALSRLLASLRLLDSQATQKAIEFTNDIIDRGRVVQREEDEIIYDIQNRLFFNSSDTVTSAR